LLCIYYDKYFRTKHTIEDKLEKAANYSDSDNNDNNLSNYYLKIFDEDLCLSDTDDLTSDKIYSKINKKNVSYNLFEIGQTDLPEHERIKHGVKVYQMLVRTKTDGVEVRIFLVFILIISIELCNMKSVFARCYQTINVSL